METGCIKHQAAGKEKYVKEMPIADHTVGIKVVLEALLDKEYGVLETLEDIEAVGHRVVHGGKSTHSVIVTPEVISNLEDYSELAPLHNPAALKGYLAIKKNLPEVKQVFVYDTAFHQTMPDYAYTYALPYDICEKYKIRRYGFHGTSHRFVSQRAAEFLNWDITTKKIITCHIGNGASITAIDGGKVVDTSMGLTPLEGLVMGTRSGDVDPSIVTFLMDHMGISAQEMADMVQELKMVVRPEGTCVLEVNGEPAGFYIAIPNMNHALKELKGSLCNPWRVLKALWAWRRIKDARLIMLGVSPQHRHRGIDLILIKHIIDHGVAIWNEAELSWVLEDNQGIIRGILECGCWQSKRYRLYQKSL